MEAALGSTVTKYFNDLSVCVGTVPPNTFPTCATSYLMSSINFSKHRL